MSRENVETTPLSEHACVDILIAQVRAAIVAVKAGGDLRRANLDDRLFTDRLQDTIDGILSAREREAAERDRLRQALSALRPALFNHYLAGIECDHEGKRDRPSCACSLVDLGWHPTVGDAVRAWIEHFVAQTPIEAAIAKAENANG